MADFKDCPLCGLINPSAVRKCDCGYDFISGRCNNKATRDRFDPASTNEQVLCFLLPGIGLFAGFMVATVQGRSKAGSRMMLISSGMIAFWLCIRLLFVTLVASNGWNP